MVLGYLVLGVVGLLREVARLIWFVAFMILFCAQIGGVVLGVIGVVEGKPGPGVRMIAFGVIAFAAGTLLMWFGDEYLEVEVRSSSPTGFDVDVPDLTLEPEMPLPQLLKAAVRDVLRTSAPCLIAVALGGTILYWGGTALEQLESAPVREVRTASSP